MFENEIRRLILAKSLFMHGCRHANAKDEVSRMIAIHNFDNVVEIVLKCVATKRRLKLGKKYIYFEDLLDEMKDLPLRDQMRGLHRVRNIVQHQGDVPSYDTVIKYKGYVEDFLREVIENEFKVSFDELSLASLIGNLELRELVRKAEKSFENRRYKECVMWCEKALVRATFDVADIFAKAGMLTGYFGAGDELRRVLSRGYAERYKGSEFYDAVKDLSEAISQLGQAATGMQFFDEYRSRFLEHRETVNNLDEIPDKELKERARLSLEFVIGLILKWQEEGLIRNSDERVVES